MTIVMSVCLFVCKTLCLLYFECRHHLSKVYDTMLLSVRKSMREGKARCAALQSKGNMQNKYQRHKTLGIAGVTGSLRGGIEFDVFA